MSSLPFVLLVAACYPLEPDMPVYDDVDNDGYTVDEGDCVDLDPTAHPGAEEVCDGVDNDCDGQVDEGLDATWYRDRDGDGHGLLDYPRTACSQPEGHSSLSDDCDDDRSTIYPGADERCNGIDDDCDGDVDEDGAVDAPTWYADADSDGYGNPAVSSEHCDGPSGMVANDDDCDDTNAIVYPGAPEVTLGVDNDCDGSVGNTLPVAWPEIMNAPPVSTCDVVDLDGTSSYDPDGDALNGYEWSVLSAPDSSTLGTFDLEEPGDPQPTFVPDVAGAYSFGLIVSDPEDDSPLATVDLEVEQRSFNGTPVADAGPDQTAEGTTVCSETSYRYSCSECSSAMIMLDGSDSVDPNGDGIRYSWTSDSSHGSISADDEQTVFLFITGIEGEKEALVVETITVTLEVTDCMLASDTDTMDIVYTCQEATEER